MLKRSSPDTVAVKLALEKASGRHLYRQQKEKAISPRLQQAHNEPAMLVQYGYCCPLSSMIHEQFSWPSAVMPQQQPEP
eukprot:367364-Pelagomonas_calceolata.AAC.1